MNKSNAHGNEKTITTEKFDDKKSSSKRKSTHLVGPGALDGEGVAVEEDEVALGAALGVAHGGHHDVSVGQAVHRVRCAHVQLVQLLRLHRRVQHRRARLRYVDGVDADRFRLTKNQHFIHSVSNQSQYPDVTE